MTSSPAPRHSQPNEIVDSHSESTTQARIKRVYSSPVLKDYGNLLLRTQGTGGTKSDGSVKTKVSSERALKTEVTLLGQHPSGFGIYAFRYKDGVEPSQTGRLQIGCMIDEVEQVIPDAISFSNNGTRLLDYSALPPVDQTAFTH